MTSIYRTARGRPVDIVSIAKKNENRIALGNAHMNGRGDILGKGGKVIETREEQLKKFYEGNRIKNKVQETVNLKEDSRKEIESELQQVQEDRFVKAKADYDDGVKVYDIEFTHKGMEYEYEISAKTGKILSFEKDRI